MMRFTPPPAHLARPEVLKGVCDRAKMVADALGLNGVAQLDAFMHADSADLVLVNAHAIPDMSPASDIFQQWEATTEVRLMEVTVTPDGVAVAHSEILDTLQHCDDTSMAQDCGRKPLAIYSTGFSPDDTTL